MWAGLAFVVLIICGMPIGFAIGMAGVVGLIDMGGTQFLAIGPSKIFNGLNIFPFLAMPFFILAGEIMNDIGITQRLVKVEVDVEGPGRRALPAQLGEAHDGCIDALSAEGFQPDLTGEPPPGETSAE